MSDNVSSILDSFDLTGVDTTRPLLPANAYRVRVISIKEQPAKDKASTNLEITYALEDSATSLPNAKGETKVVSPGFQIYDTISLKVTEKYHPKERLAKFQHCFLGRALPAFNPLEQYIGQTGTLRLKPEYSDEFGNKMRVADYLAKV